MQTKIINAYDAEELEGSAKENALGFKRVLIVEN